MSIRISEETIVLVGVVIGIFLMALICLACSLNPRELWDGSLFRCCRCCRRRSSDSEESHVYETLNEFIFEAENHSGQTGVVSLNNTPTTMEQVFPDLLGSTEPAWRSDPETTRSGITSSDANIELSEPLL